MLSAVVGDALWSALSSQGMILSAQSLRLALYLNPLPSNYKCFNSICIQDENKDEDTPFTESYRHINISLTPYSPF